MVIVSGSWVRLLLNIITEDAFMKEAFVIPIETKTVLTERQGIISCAIVNYKTSSKKH